MGKYAAFVWPSYIASALVLTGLVVLSLRARAKLKEQLKALEQD